MTLDAMWQRIAPTSACWEWNGAKTPLGYAVLRMPDGRNGYVHRIVYRILIGPIPTGSELDHLCRNPGCLNPDHLEPVSHRTNITRGKAAIKAARTHCRRGHRLSADSVFTRADGARCCRQCRAPVKFANALTHGAG